MKRCIVIKDPIRFGYFLYRDESETEEDAKPLLICERPGCGNKECKPHEFKLCARCNRVVYCNKNCQVKHWKFHKKNCNKVDIKVGKNPSLPSIPCSSTSSPSSSLSDPSSAVKASEKTEEFDLPLNGTLPKNGTDPIDVLGNQPPPSAWNPILNGTSAGSSSTVNSNSSSSKKQNHWSSDKNPCRNRNRGGGRKKPLRRK